MSREDRKPEALRGAPVAAVAVGPEIAWALARLLKADSRDKIAKPAPAPETKAAEGYWRRYY